MKIGQPNWILLTTTIMQIFHYIHFELKQFRSKNIHSSHAWKKWKWTTSLPCFTYLSHAQTLCEHPKFWRVLAFSHARVHAHTRCRSLCVHTLSVIINLLSRYPLSTIWWSSKIILVPWTRFQLLGWKLGSQI